MSNINWGQFLNNFANNMARISNANLQNLTATAETFEPPVQNNTASSLFPNTTAQLSQTASELANMNAQQSVNMLKDLMNMPKNFDQLLSQLATNNKTVSQETVLLLLTSSLDMSKLSSMLQTNSKQAMTNLYQMLAQYNQLGLSLKDEQVGQLTKLISFTAASTSSDVQTLKTTMLMYLPWLPLTDPEAFKLEMAKKSDGGTDGSDDSISVLMQTENYGNAKCDVFKTSEDGIKIIFTSSELFPQKDFQLLMKEEGIKYNININFEFSKKAAFNPDKVEKSQTQVFLNTSPGVNPFLLLISNTIIKNVHSIDIKQSLREIRKENIENKKPV
ncbi:hypothetical protein II906_02545 [bacterium]|nr:hypothetical protein [bacterium]